MDGQFIKPSGIAVDSSGNVFVVDTGNTRIQVFAESPSVPP
ncbi:MAG: SBBP repeat-containing protein [Nitrososphaeraceae archaeon]|nr:SBBP repeat-containing protein [Nitrososphaeraceae archaeon]